MKLLRVSFLFLCGLLILSGSAQALTLKDVGVIDEIKAAGLVQPPNDANETNFILNAVGNGYAIQNISNSQNLGAANWTQLADDPSVYALELGDEPGYFFILLASQFGVLYENRADLGWAVVDIDAWTAQGYVPPGKGEIKIGRVSHIREVPEPAIPEPATMLLLGCGLIGLAAFGRKGFFKGA